MQNYKQILRQDIITKCKYLTTEYKNNASNKILLNSQVLLSNSANIAIYRAYAWEVNLNPVIKHCISLQKNIFQPIAFKHDKNMMLEPYCETTTNIFSNIYDANHPETSIRWYNLDLIFIPVVAVDKFGVRLGKGGGYYDTTLSDIKYNRNKNTNNLPILCGVGYACQLIEHIPYESWDIKLDYFVSDESLTKF